MSAPEAIVPRSASRVSSLLAEAASLGASSFPRARSLYLEAIQLDAGGEARNTFGLFLWRQARYAEAAQQFAELLRQADERADTRLAAVAANNLAVIYRESGESAAAAHFQQYALQLELQLGASPARLSSCLLGNLAADAILAEDYGRAERLLWLSCRQEMTSGSLEGQASDWGNLGILAGLQGNLRQGIEYLWRALRLHRVLRDPRGIGCDLWHLGQLIGKSGRWRPAIRVLAAAEQRLRAAELHELASRARSDRAEFEKSLRLAEFDPARN